MKTIAVLGPEGTFSDSACRRYQEEYTASKPVYYPSIDEAFYAVGEQCSCGIIPIENTLDGYVQRTLDLLLELDVRIVRELAVPVQFSLVVNGTSLADLERLYVQFKAKGQCCKLVQQLSGKKVITTESNMESFHIAKEGRPGDGAVIPRHMYGEYQGGYGLENVTDSEQNFTRFIAVVPANSSNPSQSPFARQLDGVELGEKVKVSLYIVDAADHPGSLFEILRVFSERRINLVSIMSRPTKKTLGAYNFFLELSGSIGELDTIQRTLEQLGKDYHIKLLGIYSEQ